MDENKIIELQRIIDESNYIVFFGGAGVSVESGIPDFRSDNGIYKKEYHYPPETILSHTFFNNHPEEFYDFYTNNMLFPKALPNNAHNYLARLEKIGKLKAVITQNIDNLHQMAGNNKVFELHGSVYRNYCTKCGKIFNLDYIISSNKIPKCDECNGIVKPDVVLYEESLDMDVITNAVNHIMKCDCLIVGGTSLSVYPAAGFIQYFRGKSLIIINKSYTSYDKNANLVINDSIGEVFSRLK